MQIDNLVLRTNINRIMKNKLFIIAITLCSCLKVFSQATSLTVDCQTPGWLSSMINYGDQQTLENIKVTGYINGTDIQFIYDLNSQRALTGVIDLGDVSIVSGGTLYTNGYPRTINKDNVMPPSFFYDQKNHIKKFIYPKTLVEEPSIPFQKEGLVDSLIWTSTNVKSLNVSNGIGYASYIYIPEGVETISQIPNNIRIVLPSTIQNVGNYGVNNNLTIYSFIESPENVYAKHEDYYADIYGGHRSYWAAIANSTFYIPKGTLEKYLESDFSTMKAYYEVNGNLIGKDNGNTFIEYYDIESTVVNAPNVIYKGETQPIDVNIYPNANLVDRIDYKSSNSEIISVNSSGTIEAKDYGQAEIYATPHLFIDGLETKTGSCFVKVIAHTEGIEMASSLPIHIDEEKRLEAFTLPLNYSDNKITFFSSDSSIAEVSEEGVVKGVKKGTCTITATSVDGGYTATCEVTVTQPVETLTLEKHSITLKVGESERLFAQISPSKADDKTISWHSSNEQIAYVDADGNVIAIKAGEAWIKAVSQDNVEAKDSCKVTVTQPVTGIQLDSRTYMLNGIGESFELKATIVPEDASNQNVKWTSSDESVCVVSQGYVVAVGYGTCVIIATTEDGGYMATCTVTVNNLTDISNISLDRGKKFQVYDTNGSKRNHLERGVNIISFVDGTKKKVIIK